VRVGVVVLHFRFWPEIRSTLSALLAQTRPPDRIVVVDNRSSDGSVPRLREAFPSVEVIEAPSNLGYGGGMNLGLEHLLEGGMDAVLLLTHECRMAPDALEALIARLDDAPAVGALGPLLAYRSSPDVVFSAGGEIDPAAWRPRHVREPRLVAEWAGAPPRAVEWLDGAAVLVRAAAVRDAGPLDEGYFLYFEETEYLLSLQRLGWSVECVPAALAWQEPGNKPTYLWLRNRLRFLARTAPKRHVLRETSRLAASVLKNSIVPNRMLTRAQIQDRRRALVHFLARRWGPDSRRVDAEPSGNGGLAESLRAARSDDRHVVGKETTDAS
jgi:GT2 family glycosyltransferase